MSPGVIYIPPRSIDRGIAAYVARDHMMTVSCRLVAVAVALALAAALLSSSPLHGDVREVVEIRDVELIPVDGGAAGPESVAFGVGGGSG